MFFILCDTWEILIFTKAYCYSEVFINHHIVAFFEASVLKYSELSN